MPRIGKTILEKVSKVAFLTDVWYFDKEKIY